MTCSWPFMSCLDNFWFFLRLFAISLLPTCTLWDENGVPGIRVERNRGEIQPFTVEELWETLKETKPGKAQSLDKITVEAIKETGWKEEEDWLLGILNRLLQSFETFRRQQRSQGDVNLEKSQPLKTSVVLSKLNKTYETLKRNKFVKIMEEYRGRTLIRFSQRIDLPPRLYSLSAKLAKRLGTNSWCYWCSK